MDKFDIMFDALLAMESNQQLEQTTKAIPIKYNPWINICGHEEGLLEKIRENGASQWGEKVQFENKKGVGISTMLLKNNPSVSI